MRKLFLPLFVLAGAIPLAGCAVVPFVPMAAEIVRSESQRGVIGEDFGAAATEACTARGTRYGRTTVTRTEPLSNGNMRVYGTIEQASGTHNFVCEFRPSGSIATFNRS